MFKIACVPVSLGVCLASLSLASGAIVATPYLLASRSTPAKTKSTQCRALFSAVVNSQNMGSGFYRRKANSIRTIALTEPKLRSLQTQFSKVFEGLESASVHNDSQGSQRLSQQATKLVNELNQHCFR